MEVSTDGSDDDVFVPGSFEGNSTTFSHKCRLFVSSVDDNQEVERFRILGLLSKG